MRVPAKHRATAPRALEFHAASSTGFKLACSDNFSAPVRVIKFVNFWNNSVSNALGSRYLCFVTYKDTGQAIVHI